MVHCVEHVTHYITEVGVTREDLATGTVATDSLILITSVTRHLLYNTAQFFFSQMPTTTKFQYLCISP